MKKIHLFFVSLVAIACFLILSGAIVLASGQLATSTAFFISGGVPGLAGLIGLLVSLKE